MRKSTLQSKSLALSVLLASLMPLQQLMALSIPVDLLNPDEQDIDLELWRGPYAEIENELRYMLGDESGKMVPEILHGNFKYPMKTFDKTDNPGGLEFGIDDHGTRRDDNIRTDRPAHDSNRNKNSEDSVSTVNKRKTVRCDLSNVTLNMLLEYVKTGRICGSRASPVRFGLGK